MQKFQVLVSLLLLFAAANCSKNVQPPADLQGNEWRLVSIQKDALPSGVNATLKIENEQVGGSGGCNRFSGSSKVDGSNLTFSMLSSTKMYCENGQQWEDRYLRMLEKAEKFKIVGNELTISNADGNLVFLKN